LSDSSSFRLWRWLAGAAALAFVLSPVGVWIWLDSDAGQRLVIDRANAALGRSVHIEEVDVVPGWPLSFRLRGVSVANASWGGERPFLEAREIRITPEFVALLGGEFVPARVEFEGATVRAARNDAGAGNWPSVAGRSASGPLPTIAGRDLRLHHTTPAREGPRTLRFARVNVSGQSTPARLNISNNADGTTLNASRNILAALRGQSGSPALDATIENDGGRLQYQGQVALAQYQAEGELQWRLDAPNEFFQPLGVSPLPLPPLDLTARLETRNNRLYYDLIELQTLGGHITGQGELEADAPPAMLHASGSIDSIDLQALIPPPEADQPAFSGRLFGHYGLDFSLERPLDTLSGHIVLLVRKGRLPQALVERATVDIGSFLIDSGNDEVRVHCGAGEMRIERGVGHIESLALRTPGATIAAQGKVDFRERQLDISLQADASNVGFLDTSTPIHIGGSFSQPRISANFSHTLIEGGAKALLGWISPPVTALIAAYQRTGGTSSSECESLTRKARPLGNNDASGQTEGDG
jgi:uncharacterized protein involved in outer membrane biogenesis